jgi:hypothetical protein
MDATTTQGEFLFHSSVPWLSADRRCRFALTHDFEQIVW